MAKFEIADQSVKNVDEQVRAAEKALANARLLKKRTCFHTAKSGTRLIPIKDAKWIPDREKQKYSNTTFVCEGCHEIIETALFTRNETNDMFFNLHSMLAQIQMLTGPKLSEAEQTELMDALEKADYLETLIGTFYNDMVERLSDRNKKGPKRSTNKGGIGINSGMMQ